MATQKQAHTDPEVSIEQALTKTELFIEKNGKALLVALTIIALVVGSFFAYQHFYAAPRAEKATNAMFEAQIQFERDSFAVALNGVKGVFVGFDEITTQFEGTPQANIAHHYAGICEMKMGNFEKAITYFEKFKNHNTPAADIINAQNYGLIGDCHIELGKNDLGVKLYTKAINASKSDATAPIYTHKAAVTLYSEGKFNEALTLFKTLKSQYPQSFQARDADKYIALTEQKI